jgi:hypothetical protein
MGSVRQLEISKGDTLQQLTKLRAAQTLAQEEKGLRAAELKQLVTETCSLC